MNRTPEAWGDIVRTALRFRGEFPVTDFDRIISECQERPYSFDHAEKVIGAARARYRLVWEFGG